MDEGNETVNPTINTLRKKPHVLTRSSSFGEAPVILNRSSKQFFNSPSATDPSSHRLLSTRWAILILSGFVLFGNYFAFDLPASLNSPLKDYMEMDYASWQWTLNTMYSSYSFPNMFLPVIGGHFIDHYDQKKVLIFLSLIICIGQTLVALGITFKIPWLMISGRFLFGVGGECISVSESAIITSWFKGKELGFALGMNLCIARLGSVTNSMFSPIICKYSHVLSAIWFGTFTCYSSFIATILLVGIIGNTAVKQSPHEIDSERHPLLETPTSYSPRNSEIRKDSIFTDFLCLPFSFWLLCLLCITLYGTVIPFNATASDFLMSKWYLNDIESAGLVMSIPDVISFFVVPLFGYVIDHGGHRISWLLFCSLLIGSCHFNMGFFDFSPVPSMIGLGFGYAINGVVLWPSLAMAIQKREDELEETDGNSMSPSSSPPPRIKLLGTAFGFSMAALNTALTIVPLVAAKIRIQGDSFVPVELFYSALALTGAVFALLLLCQDAKTGYFLQKSTIMDEFVHQAEVDEIQSSSLSLDINSELDHFPQRASPSSTDRISNHTFKSFLSRELQEPEVLGTTRFFSRIDRSDLDTFPFLEADQLSIE